jgi:hypothetical protein
MRGSGEGADGASDSRSRKVKIEVAIVMSGTTCNEDIVFLETSHGR